MMNRGRWIYPVLFILAAICNGCEKSGDTDPVKDFEGNSYKTVQLGDQVWMAENLRSTLFSDGAAITEVTDPGEWMELESPGMCWYDNDEVSYRSPYGALYNFHAVSSGRLCPSGWHVPSKGELLELRQFLGDTLTAGGSLKEKGTEHWKAPNAGATNSTGFTAVPSGIRYHEGTFSSLTTYSSIWTSTEADAGNAWFLGLYFNDAAAGINKTSKQDGFSVRCIRD